MSFEKSSDHALFRCTLCGQCCIGYGGTYVSGDDIKRIANFLSINPVRFKDKFCRTSGDKLILTQAESGYCIFWDKVCTIHPVKPEMCRKWPFIESLLIDISNWIIMANSCPGINSEASCQEITHRVKTTQISGNSGDPGK